MGKDRKRMKKLREKRIGSMDKQVEEHEEKIQQKPTGKRRLTKNLSNKKKKMRNILRKINNH